MKNNDGTKQWQCGLAAAFIVLVAFFLIDRLVDLSQMGDLAYVQARLLSFGGWSIAVFIVVMALAIVVSPLPSLPLDVAAGILWGPYWATVFAVIGASIGATVSFFLARWLGRGLVEKIFHKHIDFCHRCKDWTFAFVIFIARLLPFIQFDIVSYGAGLTKMRFWPFFLATLLGMIPMTFVFASLGELYVFSKTFTVVFSLVLVLGMFVLPYYFYKYNLFGFANRIKVEDTD